VHPQPHLRPQPPPRKRQETPQQHHPQPAQHSRAPQITRHQTRRPQRPSGPNHCRLSTQRSTWRQRWVIAYFYKIQLPNTLPNI
jgi:hypothetical protein